MATIDPFTNIEGTVQPLTVGISENEYSIKLITQKTTSSDKQIHNYVGAFESSSDSANNAMGIQAQIMVALETAIQDLYSTTYDIGNLPTLGRPGGIDLENNDIIVSFAQRGDYFVFRGTGPNRIVFFVASGVNTYWEPESTPNPFFPEPTNHTITYPTVTYNSSGDILITDSVGRNLRFDATNKDYGVTSSEVNLVLTANTNSDTYVITETDVGVTKITTLPPNHNDITFAQSVQGYFFDTVGATVPVVPTYTDLYDYIIAQEPSLTVLQKACINRMCRVIYNPVKNAIKYLMGIGTGSFALSTGYASFVSVKGMSLEIRVT